MLRLAETMTTVDLLRESKKHAEALKALSKSKSGDIAQACSLFRLQIFFMDKAWNKLSASQQIELYRRDVAKGYLDSLQTARGGFRKYCPGRELLTDKSTVLAMPPGPGITFPASEPELANTIAECTPAGSLRCEIGPWPATPSVRDVEPLRPPPPPSIQSTASQPQPQLASPATEELPQPLRFDQSLDELVRQGVVSPAERQRIRSGNRATPQQTPAHQQACRSGALPEEECNSGVVVRWRGKGDTLRAVQSPANDGLPSIEPSIKPLSSREQALLQRIRSGGHVPQWRTYGQCNYDWAGWKLQSNGIRTTAAYCGDSARRWTVGVSCDRLLVAVHTNESGWSDWKRPAGPDNKAHQGEDEMVAALCANAGVSPR